LVEYAAARASRISGEGAVDQRHHTGHVVDTTAGTAKTVRDVARQRAADYAECPPIGDATAAISDKAIITTRFRITTRF
jgi:uncharacterized Zn-binding protein involved in type VI secretion